MKRPIRVVLPTLAGATLAATVVSGVARPLSAEDACFSYNDYKHHIAFYPDEHMHGTGEAPGPGGDYWELTGTASYLSDGSNHAGHVEGKSWDHNHESSPTCAGGGGDDQ